jgi:hypothetical protein
MILKNPGVAEDSRAGRHEFGALPINARQW